MDQPPDFVNKSWDTVMPFCLHVAYCCFHTTMAIEQLQQKLPYFAMYNAHFCPNFGGKNKDMHYTWVVTEIPCMCYCVLYLLHKISCTIIYLTINAKIPYDIKKYLNINKLKQKFLFS